MSSYSSALVYLSLAAQVVAWPVVSLHQANGGLLRQPANDRAITERLLRSQLGPMAQGEDAGQMNNAIQAFRIERLNLPAAPALAVQASGQDFCGATGNCTFWIIDVRQRRIILRADAVQQFAVERSKSGFPDVITSTHASEFEHELIRWKFVGGTYQPATCATDDYAGPDGNPLPQPKITPHPCTPSS